MHTIRMLERKPSITVITTFTDFGAAGYGIPGRSYPFYFGFTHLITP